jgi:hypothetical protein
MRTPHACRVACRPHAAQPPLPGLLTLETYVGRAKELNAVGNLHRSIGTPEKRVFTRQFATIPRVLNVR